MGRLAIALLAALAQAAAATYYVDCAAGSDSGDGISQQTAWRTLEKVSQRRFLPDDSILLKRGAECLGPLWPKGSGEPGKPIRIGSWGTGPLPLVRAGGAEAAIRLFNQQYWHIAHLETSGGNPYGIHISGDEGVLRHFRLRDLVVRDVTGTVKTKNSGLIAVVAGGDRQTFDDVIIDGVTAFNSTQWAGIIVNGGRAGKDGLAMLRATGVTVRNSMVHDVYGDGIVLFQVNRGVIEYSVAWNTGMQPRHTIGTPNAIWTWRCRDCVVQHNEGFFSDSPGVDGGVFDIDWGNENNIVQYNFGHDSQGYCVAVFGAGGETTINSVVRHNVCAGNGRSPRLAREQGEIFLLTWQKGSLDGVDIHDNAIHWNPPAGGPVLLNRAEFTGTRPNRFRNNLIYSKAPRLVESNPALRLDNNRYWYDGPRSPEWFYDGAGYADFAAYQAGSRQDQHGAYSNPLLRWLEAGGRRTGRRAADFQLATPDGRLIRSADYRGRWLLVSFLDLEAAASRSQAVFLRSALYQFGPRNLEVILIGSGAVPDNESRNLPYDWNLGAIPLVMDPGPVARAYGVATRPLTLLIAPDGEIRRRWEGFASAADLGLALRALLGPPIGATPIEIRGR